MTMGRTECLQECLVDISWKNEGILLDMELYQKPVMTIAELEKLDVLTGRSGFGWEEEEEPF